MDRLPGLNEVPPAPRTPSEEARFLVLGERGPHGHRKLAGLAALVLGAVLVVVFCWGLPVDVAITLGPRTCGGTLLDAERSPGLLGGSTKVRFQYEAGGTRWTGEAVSSAIRPGQAGPIEVEYAALNPAWGRPARGTYAPFGYLGGLSLLVPLAGGCLLLAALRGQRRGARVFTHGFPALARVTFRGQDHAVKVDGRHPFLIRWEFMAGDRVCKGSLRSVELLDVKAFGEAEQVVVLYDPADPRANTLFVP